MALDYFYSLSYNNYVEFYTKHPCKKELHCINVFCGIFFHKFNHKFDAVFITAERSFFHGY